MKSVASGFVFAVVLLFVGPMLHGPVAATPTEPQKSFSYSGDTEQAAPKIEVARQTFRRTLVAAAQKAAQKGEISRRDALKIRVASFSPAFLERVEDLCVVQMAMSGEDEDAIPRDADGAIDRASINWEGLAAFLERILPLILQLIAAFGV